VPRLASLQPALFDAFYLGGSLLALPYLLALGRGRRVAEHVRRRVRDVPVRVGRRPCLWVHGVSVGEVLSARSFLERFSLEFPDWEIAVSTTTRAGLEAARRRYDGLRVFSYPFDVSFAVRRAFDRIRPDLVVIVEHELWPNFLARAAQLDVPVALTNGRLSSRSLRGYRVLSRLIRWPPRAIELYCVEDEISAARFRALGVDPRRIRVTGNFKFDNVPPVAPGIRESLGFTREHWVFVAASIHDGEEMPVLDAFAAVRRRNPAARLVLAPRRLERLERVLRAVEQRGLRVARWSAIRARAADRRADAVLVDTFGDLPGLTAAGDVVFVGGSLVPFGGHNVIEPASLGRPVVVGPHHHNFRHVVSRFLARDALVVARDAADLADKVRGLERRPAAARAMARRALETIAGERGASERTVEALRPLVESAARGTARAARRVQPEPVAW
jgi:3-deoxy-D-manno-octulosonic-acid transferase